MTIRYESRRHAVADRVMAVVERLWGIGRKAVAR